MIKNELNSGYTSLLFKEHEISKDHLLITAPGEQQDLKRMLTTLSRLYTDDKWNYPQSGDFVMVTSPITRHHVQLSLTHSFTSGHPD